MYICSRLGLLRRGRSLRQDGRARFTLYIYIYIYIYIYASMYVGAPSDSQRTERSLRQDGRARRGRRRRSKHRGKRASHFAPARQYEELVRRYASFGLTLNHTCIHVCMYIYIYMYIYKAIYLSIYNSLYISLSTHISMSIAIYIY